MAFPTTGEPAAQAQQGGADPFVEFLKLHSYQLEASGMPMHLWRLLFDKLTKEVFDGGKYFEFARVVEEEEDEEEEDGKEPKEKSSKLIVIVKDGHSIEAGTDVFLIDHAWTTSFHSGRQSLMGLAGALERVAGILDYDISSFESKEEAVDSLIQSHTLWRALNHYSFGRADGREEASVWYLMDELGTRIQHSKEPTFAMVPFLFAKTGVAYSILWPLVSVNEGDEVTRNYLPKVEDGPVRDARMCAWFEPDDDVIQDCKEAYERHEAKLKEIAAAKTLKASSSSATSSTAVLEDKFKNLQIQEGTKAKVLVYTNMDIVKKSLDGSRVFAVTEEANTARILWPIQHVQDFGELMDGRQFINQFPDEKHLTCKDLVSEAQYNYFGSLADEFLLRTYNLETELVPFVGYYLHEKEESEKELQEKGETTERVYISKPWALARGIGHYVSTHLTCLLRSMETGPRIVSRYMTNPALFEGRKFDLRFMVGVKSIRPLRLSIYKHFLTRFANKAFSLEHFDDYEKHMTVMTFAPYKLTEVEDHDFISEYEKNTVGAGSWKRIEESIHQVIIKAFTAATQQMRTFEFARALYGVDILLDDKQHPFLLEVNYSPNCDRLVKYKPHFFDDLFKELFLDGLPPESTHFMRFQVSHP